MAIPLTERQFQVQVTELAMRLGWQWLHIEKMGNPQNQWRTPATGPLGKGFPDLMMVRRSSILFAELKADGKVATPLQKTVMTVLSQVTPHTYFWRPVDFPQIVQVLTNA